jgi:hypothetical protein
MKILGILNPFLIVLINAIYLTAFNHEYLTFDTFLTLMLLISCSVLLFELITYLIIRNLQQTIKISTYVAILWFLYPIIIFLLSNIPIVAANERFSYIALIIFWILLIFIILKPNKFPLSHIFQKLIFIFSVIMIGLQAPNMYRLYKFITKNINFTQEVEILEKSSLTMTPHIIYIVPDRYASNNSLIKYFHFNNSEFTNQLKERGFYVWENQHANYPNTFMSLASTLNMNYLDKIIQNNQDNEINYSPFFEIIIDGQVQLILRNHGYTYTHMGSWWEPTRENSNAVFNISKKSYFSEFIEQYFSLTPLAQLTNYFTNVSNNQEMCELIEKQQLAILDAINKNEPQFIFWHLLISHEPYIYDQKGNCRKEKNFALENWEERKEIYTNHIQHANNLLIKLHDLVVKHSKKPVIFVIQSDEGPYPWEYLSTGSKAKEDFEFLSNNNILRFKFGMFNAIYLPSKDYKYLAKDSTPINNFRHIFNEIFNYQLPLLDNRSYTYNKEKDLYELYDITTRLNQ